MKTEEGSGTPLDRVARVEEVVARCFKVTTEAGVEYIALSTPPLIKVGKRDLFSQAVIDAVERYLEKEKKNEHACV